MNKDRDFAFKKTIPGKSRFKKIPKGWHSNMSNFFLVSFLLLSMSAISQQKKIVVSDLPLQGYRQEVLAPAVNKSMTGHPITINAKTHKQGFSVHAPFTANLYLAKKATRFTGLVGIDDVANRRLLQSALDSFAKTDGLKTYFYTNGNDRELYGVGYRAGNINPGSVVLTIAGDGKKMWSAGIRQGQDAKPFDVDVTGITLLTISVTDHGDGISGDVANLVNLEIQTAAPASIKFVPESYKAEETAKNNVTSKKVSTALQKLPLYDGYIEKKDWLLEQPKIAASVTRDTDGQIIMSNGLVSRTITVLPNAATTSLKNLTTGEEFIRAVEPEAIVTLDEEVYNIGGLGGQTDRGYLLQTWLKNMHSLPGSFQLNDIKIEAIKPTIAYTAKRWAPATQWKATGKELILSFVHPNKKGVVVQVHHRIYDGLPLVTKTISVINNSGKDIVVNHFVGEVIAYPEKENFVAVPVAGWSKPNFYIENDYAFGGMSYDESNQSISWEPDSLYTSQVNYQLQTPCIVKSTPKEGPAQVLTPGQQWKSFNTHVLLLNGEDRERNTLSRRKMYRTLAPWVTENPIFMHLASTNPEVVKEAVDQCVATGYEMIVLSFGSGLNIEDTSKKNLDKFKMLAGYAHNKGIQIGGYSLFSSRSIDAKNDVINVKTGKPGGATFGNAPCMGSVWGLDYLKKVKYFFDYTGFDLLEHDGPYPGDFCASNNHPGHKDYYDSQWKQWTQSTDLYQSLLAKAVYINTPDFYMLSGANKTSVGYREVNWSLPRAQQILLGRQNLYDGTWTRTPSMVWTFTPLTQYQGGGAAATIEPLSEHLKDYAAHMQQNYGSGVQSCYRGNRLYDTEATKEVVKKEIAHYKKYRDILNADIIHLRRPTGRDWDGILHVDPRGKKEKGLAMLYNPLDKDLTVKIKLPLYYTGIKKIAAIGIEGKPPKTYPLDKDNNVLINLTIPAQKNIWLVVEPGKNIL